MPGRNKLFTHEEVIGKAVAVFREKGYDATSTDDLLDAMGIGKSSFYHSFPGGKKEVFAKALVHFNNISLQQLKHRIKNSPAPIEEVRSFFRAIATGAGKDHLLGCFMGNAIAGLSYTDPELAAKAAGLLQELEQVFYDAVRKARQTGEITSTKPPALIARSLLTSWNGLSITRRIYPDPKKLKQLIGECLSILH